MTTELRILTGGFLGAALVGLAYVTFIWLSGRKAAAHRRRREARLAVTIRPPRDWSGFGRAAIAPVRTGLPGRLWQGFSDVAFHQPLLLPLVTSIPFASLFLLLVVDPVLDEPMIWAGTLPDGLHAWIPGWFRAAWITTAIVAAISTILWVFWMAPRRISRHWLVLGPDGSISSPGAPMPVLHPSRARAAGPTRRTGFTIRQEGVVFAFHLPNRAAGTAPNPRHVPDGWFSIDGGPDAARLDAFLQRHYAGE